jgi:hypothetical protein
MNLNNLEDRKAELKAFGVSDENIAEMETKMTAGVKDFTLREIIHATRGQVEISIPFKQSGQSDNYYFNKFTVVHNKLNPLEEGHKYFVMQTDLPKKDGHVQFKSYVQASDAMALFNKQENSELLSGKDLAGAGKIALREKGKLNYVRQDYRSAMYTKPIEQNFWNDRGKGFTVEQMANLIQGRAVHKEELVNGQTGEIYKAWVKLDMEAGKENGNFKLQQYHEQYGFDLAKVLDQYKIKELADPAKREILETSLKNGNRPLVLVEKDSQKVPMLLEASVRYGKLNFFDLDGKLEKREQFLKEPVKEVGLAKEKSVGKQQQHAAEHGLGA